MALSAVLCLLVWSGESPAQVTPNTVDEYQAKATFLINFGKFIQWPSPGDTLVIGIVGHDPLGPRLDGAVKNLTINGRIVVTRRFGVHEDFTSSHILFVSHEEEKRSREILARARGLAILTVGETASFAREGGIVRLFVEHRRLRFQIDVKAAEEVGLKLHSGLLALAAR